MWRYQIFEMSWNEVGGTFKRAEVVMPLIGVTYNHGSTLTGCDILFPEKLPKIMAKKTSAILCLTLSYGRMEFNKNHEKPKVLEDQ
jgi:hypothetical protein